MMSFKVERNVTHKQMEDPVHYYIDRCIELDQIPKSYFLTEQISCHISERKKKKQNRKRSRQRSVSLYTAWV